MGGEFLDSPPTATKQLNTAESITDLCSYYMSIGMTWDEYWHGPAELPRVYREKDELERKRKNQDAWLGGVYMQYAIASTLSKDAKYPSQPIPLTVEEAEKQKRDEFLAQRDRWVKQIKAEQEAREKNGV